MFYTKNLRKVPHAKAFARAIERLKDHDSAHPRPATGKEPLSVEEMEKVKTFSQKMIKVIFQKLPTD